MRKDAEKKGRRVRGARHHGHPRAARLSRREGNNQTRRTAIKCPHLNLKRTTLMGTRRPADSPKRLRDTLSGAPSALRGIHRQGVRNRNDILPLSVLYSLSYEEVVKRVGAPFSVRIQFIGLGRANAVNLTNIHICNGRAGGG